MSYSFNADSIDIGEDDTEEFYSITFAEHQPGGGPALNYLTMQRSTDLAGAKELGTINIEPYIELNDPSNGRYATAFRNASLGADNFTLTIKPGSGIVTHPGLDEATFEIDELIVTFQADTHKQRRLRLAMELVIADAFELTYSE